MPYETSILHQGIDLLQSGSCVDDEVVGVVMGLLQLKAHAIACKERWRMVTSLFKHCLLDKYANIPHYHCNVWKSHLTSALLLSLCLLPPPAPLIPSPPYRPCSSSPSHLVAILDHTNHCHCVHAAPQLAHQVLSNTC